MRETLKQGTLIWSILVWISLLCLWCLPFGITNYSPAQRCALSSSFWSPTPSFPCRALTCTPIQKCTPQTSLDQCPSQNKASKMWEAMRPGMEGIATMMCRSSTLHCPPHQPNTTQPGAKLMSLVRSSVTSQGEDEWGTQGWGRGALVFSRDMGDVYRGD